MTRINRILTAKLNKVNDLLDAAKSGLPTNSRTITKLRIKRNKIEAVISTTKTRTISLIITAIFLVIELVILF